MRFTNDIRRQIVADVMADIPVIDYAGQMAARALAMGVAALPPAARKVWDDPDTRHHLQTQHHSLCCVTARIPGLLEWNDREKIMADPEWKALHEAFEAQRETIQTLRQQVKVNVALCNSRKAFVERFPDLAKYAPTDASAAVANLPATTNLIEGLRAAGLKLEPA